MGIHTLESLTGIHLSYWVARALDYEPYLITDDDTERCVIKLPDTGFIEFNPHVNNDKLVELINKHRPDLTWDQQTNEWVGTYWYDFFSGDISLDLGGMGRGTYAEAALRCIVDRFIGKEVPAGYASLDTDQEGYWINEYYYQTPDDVA